MPNIKKEEWEEIQARIRILEREKETFEQRLQEKDCEIEEVKQQDDYHTELFKRLVAEYLPGYLFSEVNDMNSYDLKEAVCKFLSDKEMTIHNLDCEINELKEELAKERTKTQPLKDKIIELVMGDDEQS